VCVFCVCVCVVCVVCVCVCVCVCARSRARAFQITKQLTNLKEKHGANIIPTTSINKRQYKIIHNYILLVI